MQKRRLFLPLFLLILTITLLQTPARADYGTPQPIPKCWHFNCWTYFNGQTMCDWEVETCDGRWIEIPE